MLEKKSVVRELWDRQLISPLDVDYKLWEQKRENISNFSRFTSGCIFTVDVFKGIYDFASDHFSRIFGYNPGWIKTIREHGDLLEERIHPDDRQQILEYQVEHGQFIYSLPSAQRNDYQQIFQYRVCDVKRRYVNVISRQQVIQQDKNNKAWIIMGVMDIAPDQDYSCKVRRTVINRKTGEIIRPHHAPESAVSLTSREKEVLAMIRRGFLSKEIAARLKVSIYTIHNHRKNILAKLKVDNMMEAVNQVSVLGILD